MADSSHDSEKSVGLADYLGAFRRRRMLMLGIAMPVACIAALIAFALPSVYESKAVFRLQNTTSADAIRQSYSDQVIAGVTQFVLSPDHQTEVIQKYKPYPDLDPVASMGKLTSDVKVTMITGTVRDPDSGHDKVINTGFTVTYQNANPKTAHEVASWLASAYSKGGRAKALDEINNQLRFLNAQTETTRAHVTELESKLAEFKRKNFDQLPESSQTNLAVRGQAEQELSQVDREISAQQQNRIFMMQQLQTAQASSAGGNLGALEEEYKRRKASYDESHPDMVSLRRQIDSARRGGTVSNDGTLQAELQSKRSILAETRLRYSADHPDVRALSSDIASLERRIAAGERTSPNAVMETAVVSQLKTQLHAIDTQIASLQGRKIELRTKYAVLDSRLASTPQVEREYEALNRDLGAARTQYQDVANQRSRAEMVTQEIAGGTADKFELVGPPGVPSSPAKPARGGIVMLGLLAALALSFIAATVAEVVDNAVRGTRDLISTLSVAPLAIIPEIRNSNFRKRRTRQLVTAAASFVIAVPIVFLCVRMVVR